MSVVGLFAGIGGFELGCAAAGLETMMLAEIDGAARHVLQRRFADVPLVGDVAQIGALPADATIVTAGFPCQNLSMAGDKSGIEGSKSSAVRHLFDLLECTRVPTVVIENVYFLLQLDAGRGMGWLVGEFERLGYTWAYRVLDSMGFGLPHRRRRVYLVACQDADPRAVLFPEDGGGGAAGTVLMSDAALGLLEGRLPSVPVGFYWTEGRSGVGLTLDGIPPLKVGSALGIASAPAVLFPDGEVLTPSVMACERLQGFPAGWIPRDDEPTGRSTAWRLIGNAVSVPVARWVAERLRAPGRVGGFELVPIQRGRRWPDAAWNVGTGATGVRASDRPLGLAHDGIAAYRDGTWRRLSARALDGFVTRARAGRLRIPGPFLDAVAAAPRRSPRSEPTMG